jgi:hypothetical protein
MLYRVLVSAVVIGAALCGCAHDERQWMKLDQTYTIADFQRDHAACSKNGTLDEACMRAKGWIDVNPSSADRAADKPPPPNPGRYR